MTPDVLEVEPGGGSDLVSRRWVTVGLVVLAALVVAAVVLMRAARPSPADLPRLVPDRVLVAVNGYQVDTDDVRRTATYTMHVRNLSGRPLQVASAGTSLPGLSLTDSNTPPGIDPDGTTAVSLTYRVTDCAAARGAAMDAPRIPVRLTDAQVVTVDPIGPGPSASWVLALVEQLCP